MRAAAGALAALGLALAAAGPLRAQGHGPVYGLSTPTLGRGGWSLDAAAMGRFAGDGRAVMLRPMLSYGVTEDVQLSASFPLPLARDPGLAPVRAFTRMPSTRDAEVGVGWRFQRRGLGVGARQESTLWLAWDQPLDEVREGLATSPAVFGALVTGYASRSVYVWTGGAYRRSLEAAGDRAGDVGMASLVLGYRPPFFRGDYPSPDWRGFLEVVGEWSGEDTRGAAPLPDSGRREVYLGITVLGLYGSWGIAGGPAFPLYQPTDGTRLHETLRFAANATFWW